MKRSLGRRATARSGLVMVDSGQSMRDLAGMTIVLTGSTIDIGGLLELERGNRPGR